MREDGECCLRPYPVALSLGLVKVLVKVPIYRGSGGDGDACVFLRVR